MFTFSNASNILKKDVSEKITLVPYIGKLNCMKHCKSQKCGKQALTTIFIFMLYDEFSSRLTRD